MFFEEDGTVKLYPSLKWKKPRTKKGYGHCHNFSFESKKQAIEVFTQLENYLK